MPYRCMSRKVRVMVAVGLTISLHSQRVPGGYISGYPGEVMVPLAARMVPPQVAAQEVQHIRPKTNGNLQGQNSLCAVHV